MPLVVVSLVLESLFFVFILIHWFAKTPNKRAQHMLSLTFMLLMAYNLSMTYLYYAQQQKLEFLLSHYYRFDLIIGMAICPCIYLFQKIWIDEQITIKELKLGIHALPLLPVLVYVLYFAFKPMPERVQLLMANNTEWHVHNYLLLIVFYMQLLLYLFFGLRKNWAYRKSSFTISIGHYAYNIRWLFYLYLIAFIVLIITIPICLYKSCDAYYSFLGMLVVDVLFVYLFVNSFLNTRLINQQYHVPIAKSEPQLKLPKSLIHSYIDTLIVKLQECPIYLSPNCCLASLSELTQIPVNHLSNVINQVLTINFSDLINICRVEIACEKLQDKKTSQYTLDGLYAECGFGSRYTFYRVFKKYKGLTPNEYRLYYLELLEREKEANRLMQDNGDTEALGKSH